MADVTPSGQSQPNQSSGAGGGVSQQGSESGGQGVVGGASGPGGALNSPNVIDLSEDSMVRLPGAKDPVRYGDHYRGFQSEFTKRAQAARQYQQQVGQLQQQLAEAQRRQQASQPQAQAPNKLGEIAAQLKGLTYLSGEQAAGVVQQLTEQFGAQEKALQQRDVALGLMYKKLQAMDQSLNDIQGSRSSVEFESKIQKFAKDAGIPEKLIPRVKEFYSAYEGDDLDQEFPSMLRQWYDDISSATREVQRQRVESARRTPFVPGKGGNATPGKPLQNFAQSSAKDIADTLWGSMVDGEVET